MKLGIFLTLILQLILITAGQCPHPSFIQKHLCQHCTNKEEALAFTISARGANIFANTVLTGLITENKFQVNETNGRCQNSEWRPVYQCQLRNKIKYCNLMGNYCRTYHDVGNGHMYYQCTDVK